MVWLWLSLGLAAAVVSAMLAGMIRAEAVISREGENDHALIRVTALGGLIRRKFEIPFIDMPGLRKFVMKQEQVNLNRNRLLKEKLSRTGGKRSARGFRKLRNLAAHTAEPRQWMASTLKRVHCSEVSWTTEIGTGDAAETGLCAGLVWAVKSSLLGFALHYVKLEDKPVLSVTPYFREERFTSRFRCIIRMRLGYAMLAGLHLLVRILKAKGGIRTWRNTLFKA